MSDLHSAIIRLQQFTRWSGTAAQCDIIPEGLRHPPPSSTRGLVTLGDRPVEDLEARLMCVFSDVFGWKLYIVPVILCVTSLTTAKTFTNGDGAFGTYKLNVRHYDSKD